MFTFAVLIGIYSYLIFFLGILGILYQPVVIILTILFFLGGVAWERKRIVRGVREGWEDIGKNLFFSVLLGLFVLQVAVNVIGTLGPELGFDALWYHLTLPKLYLINRRISFIPGGLLYYSAMPKIAEMLYTAALALGNERVAKLIHFCFGLLTCLVIYKLSRKFFNQTISAVAVVIFYSNLVVDWESITAYIDLARTFFEILALYFFIDWYQTRKPGFLIQSAIVLGLAITTKVLALESVVIFVLLLSYVYFQGTPSLKASSFAEASRDKSGGDNTPAPAKSPQPPLIRGSRLFPLGIFILIALVIPLPWFVFSFIHTGNPVYPFFTKLYAVTFSLQLFNPLVFISTLWTLFTHAADPISPLYLVLFPLIIYFFPRFTEQIKIICLYSLLAIIVWYFTPNTGGGRFILPYLPAFSILCAAAINELRCRNYELGKIKLSSYLIGLVVFVSMISIGYRFIANAKYIPVLFDKETKGQFLIAHLNFSYGDFYDTDGYFATHIKTTDSVLLYGFHNLYYVDFPFVDSSWLRKGDKFDFIATQHTQLPKLFKDWKEVYENQLTGVKLYRRE